MPLGKTIFDTTPACENTFWLNQYEGQNSYFSGEFEDISHQNLSSDTYINRINGYDLLCFHFLAHRYYPLLASGKIKIPILWIAWGGDYYWLIDSQKDFDLFLPRTFKYTYQNNVPYSFRFLLKYLKRFRYRNKLKALQQIDYFSPIFKEEFDLIQQNFPSFTAKFFEWNYGYIDDKVIAKFATYYCTDQKVMLGNSATPTNNHLDLFDLLQEVLKNRSVILPLSYGNKDYKEEVKESAKQMLSSELQILEDFQSTDDFFKTLMTCGNLILGSMRQQGVGTLISALYLGAKVFVFKNSINYAYFKNQGFNIFSIEELLQSPQLLDYTFSKVQIQLHREKIQSLWSIDSNRNAISQLLKQI